MPKIEIEIGIYCAKCGAWLCDQTEVKPYAFHTRHDPPGFLVPPCPTCIAEARRCGREEAGGDAEDSLGACLATLAVAREDAKELLEALKVADAEMCFICRKLNPQHAECDWCADRAPRLAAIAKAEGRQS